MNVEAPPSSQTAIEDLCQDVPVSESEEGETVATGNNKIILQNITYFQLECIHYILMVEYVKHIVAP